MSHRSEKIIALDALCLDLDEARSADRTIVFTNGCFDIIHAGHVRYLQAAQRQGDLLIVGVNDDASVRALKGPGRPVFPVDERCEILAALDCVDYVVVFHEESVEPTVRMVRPDVLVKGGDYAPEGVVGASFVESYGGQVCVLSHVPGRSSRDLIHHVSGHDQTDDLRIAEVVPVFHVENLRESLAYYTDVLGFEIARMWADHADMFTDSDGQSNFVAVRHGHFTVLLSEGSNETGAAATMLLVQDVDMLDRYHAHLVARDADVLQPPADRVWGTREMWVRDPDGHTFRIGCNLVSGHAAQGSR